jgi:hypothetical protein
VVFEKRTFLKCPFWEKCDPVFEKVVKFWILPDDALEVGFYW